MVSLKRLAKWGLGPISSKEALAHEITVRKNLNFGNEVTEILVAQMKCPKERSKKVIVATKLPKL